MTRKEKIDLILSKIPEDKKEAFVAEFREAKTKEEKLAVLKKYDATLTKDEIKAFREESMSNEISDEELDEAAGGCCSCKGSCPGYCYYGCW